MNTRYTNIITYLSDSKEGHYVIKYMSDRARKVTM
jgi:hypothetical protein